MGPSLSRSRGRRGEATLGAVRARGFYGNATLWHHQYEGRRERRRSNWQDLVFDSMPLEFSDPEFTAFA